MNTDNNLIIDKELFGSPQINGETGDKISVLHLNQEQFSAYSHVNVYMRSSLFILVLNGSTHLYINFKEYEVNKDAIVLLSFGHILRFTQVTDDFECIMLYVGKEFVDEMFWADMIYKRVKYGVKMYNIPLLKMKVESSQLLEKRLGLLDELVKPSTHIYFNEMIVCTLEVFFMDLGNIIEHEGTASDVQNIHLNEMHFQKFLELVVDHYKKEHVVEFYADALHLTAHYLTQIVRQLCGQTVSEIIFQLLYSEAKSMLKNPSLSIQQIAAELNFSDQSAFGKFFKRKKGMSPKEFRKTI
jgi:AraC family transcriptional regulator, transcriptional activator of pobA